jgi:predicted ribosomally synthesized peptide with SipW-like signal peptide
VFADTLGETLGFALRQTKKKKIKAEVTQKARKKRMRKILLSIMVIGVSVLLFGAGTVSYFSDTEISNDNYFEAGTLDLKIDCHSTHFQQWPGDGTQYVEDPIIFGEKDFVPGDKIFNWHDIKPGDFGEATISFHVYDNHAWGWLRITNIVEDGGVLTEPEEEDYPNDLGELSENMEVMLWIDQGTIPGWQGSDEDPQEGDNKWQEGEPIIFEGTMADLIYGNPVLFTQKCMKACTIYYLGWAWWVSTNVDNVIQGDTLQFDIEFYAEQWRNNPNPTDPW